MVTRSQRIIANHERRSAAEIEIEAKSLGIMVTLPHEEYPLHGGRTECLPLTYENLKIIDVLTKDLIKVI